MTLRTPTVTGMNRMPSIHLKSSARQIESQGSISCFVWNNKERFCILGDTIFQFKNGGKVESFLSRLVVGANDHVKVREIELKFRHFLNIYN